MRQRKVKNEEEKLAALVHRTIENPTALKGNWPKPCYLEMGCGKGQFIASLAKVDPEGFYIGCEGIGSAVLRAMEMIEEMDLPNVKFIADYINAPEEYFAPGELSAIYLNFSDPWPKARHAKRRLTHRDFLLAYSRILKKGGLLEIKTDNDDLFAFTLEELEESPFRILEMTRDLHNTDLPARLVTTQYEDKFRAAGKSINYCKAIID
ncbi:MAG: tRNA (guanosine(46)-N7)-methyltransferase TrmB [Firmicutes bacterium]|nr:tRNA (guanosine(46)-N7)-methyltransferase TrmB [Bacillota bacterium]